MCEAPRFEQLLLVAAVLEHAATGRAVLLRHELAARHLALCQVRVRVRVRVSLP